MKTLIAPVLAGVLLIAAFSTTAFGDEKIATRKENQQQRIAKGVANGSMTAKETAKVENKEHNLNKEIRTDRKANGGNLTNNEKKQVNQQQNKLSRDIYRDKHNGQNQ